MPAPRYTQLDLSATPYYHCVVRCVRRAFLCGRDALSGKSFDHRREWIRARLRFLADVFTIDVFAYAVMSNHLHLVVCVDEERSAGLSEDEVIARHTRVYPGTRQKLEGLLPPEREKLVGLWRERLSSLSWMMRALDEHIARLANEEDGASGHFWEGRFRCQPILDESGLLTCMAYVDLNPVRAGQAKSLHSCAFTSIQERLLDRERKQARHQKQSAPSHLAPFSGQACEGDTRQNVPAGLDAYIELLEWTGQQVAPGKDPSHVLDDDDAPSLLEQHGIDPAGLIRTLRAQRLSRSTCLGMPDAIEARARQRQQRWLRGIGLSRELG